MRLFITGGAGFIGSNFVSYLLSTGRKYEVVNYDKLTYAGNLANLEGVAGDSRYRFVRGDICDARLVEESMHGCDAVVHFAAESHVDRSIYEPAPVIETNVRGTLVLLQAARLLRVARFVHISTDEVYGDLPPGECAHEQSSLQPNSPYSASKAAADLLVRAFVRTYGFPAVITRGSNNYGPYQFPEKLLPLMISNALEDRTLPVYGDGMQQRDWIHVEDHCHGIQLALECGREGEVYNLGGGTVETNLHLVQRVLRLLGKPESLITFVKDRPGHDRRYALDCSKAAKQLGWQPRIPLDEGLQRSIDWYRRNTAWLQSVRDGEYRRYYETYYLRRDESLGAIAAAAESPSH